jgi:hypothetical protein
VFLEPQEGQVLVGPLWLSRVYPRELAQNTRNKLITLGSAPLDDPDFRAVVLRQIGEPKLSAAIEADIAGTHCHAAALDGDTKGVLRGIHRNVGAAIFFECSGGQTDKAAHLPELRFALGSPDDAAPLGIGHTEGRQARNAFGPGVDRLASATRVLAPMRDQPPPQQIERALAGFVVLADDVKLLTRRDVVGRRSGPAVGHRQAIHEGLAQGL